MPKPITAQPAQGAPGAAVLDAPAGEGLQYLNGEPVITSEEDFNRFMEVSSGKPPAPAPRNPKAEGDEPPGSEPPAVDPELEPGDEPPVEGDEPPPVEEDELPPAGGDEPPAEEFADDVIPGVKGKDFAAIPKTTREALAVYHLSNKEKLDKATEALAMFEQLQADPIAKHRFELITQGQNYHPYQLPQLDKRQIEQLRELAADEETAPKLAATLTNIAQRMAETIVDNERIADSARRRDAEVNAKGAQIILDAAKMHPELKAIEGEPEKLKASPIYKTIVAHCMKMGWKHDTVSRLTPRQAYAIVAAENGWPLAINTQQRDLKMIGDQVEKAMSVFRKAGGQEAARILMARGSSGANQEKGKHIIDGIDTIKLASDPAYHEQVLYSKTSADWPDRVTELRRQGEKIVAARKSRRNMQQQQET
jgi:hypothetical protein